MRQILTLMVIIIVCVFVCGLANSTSNNNPQGKWEYCTAEYAWDGGKSYFYCFPHDAIPDVNSVKQTVESKNPRLNSTSATTTDFANVFGNSGWELITIMNNSGSGVSVLSYTFKRHK